MNSEDLLRHYERIADAPDAVARLRQLVLDLALRGKLGAQDPSDESAVELARRMAAEKQRLLQAKAIQAERAGAELDGVEPFEAPESWAWVAFGDLHSLVRGVTYSKADVAEAPGAGFVPVFQLAISAPSSLSRLLALHKGIGAKHVNVSDMRTALIPLAPIAEQRQIVAKVEELMALCDRLETSLARGDEQRRRLLEALLHEALEPDEAHKEAA